MRKMGSFVYLSCLLPELCSLKCQKFIIYCIFCWWQQKLGHSLGKILKFICKILFSSFRKCYVLLDSELPLAVQDLKMLDFCIFLFTFFCFFFNISTLNISETLIPNTINHIISWIKINKVFQIHLNILPKLWLVFCCHQQKIPKMKHLWHFNYHSSGSKHDN